MGRAERREYFERLIAMRDGYAGSGDDRRAVLSVDDAIRYVEAILTAVESETEPWLDATDEASADGAGGSVSETPRSRRPPGFASDLWPWPTRSRRAFGRHRERDGS